MSIAHGKPSAPSDDKRWHIVDTRMRRLGNRRDALIEALHAVQQAFGSIDRAALRYLSDRLAIPPSTVFGVATFYHYFRLRPQGEHTVIVCTGTACYINGAHAIVAAIEDRLALKPDETTADGKLSLQTGRCFGSCSLAPAAILDGRVRDHVDTSIVNELEAL